MGDPPVFALATGTGGAIAIIRLTGRGSLDIARLIFVSASQRPRKKFSPGLLCYGYLKDPSDNSLVDEVFCVYFPEGGSYTSEEMVEFHCHGSRAIIEKTSELLLSRGVKAAPPGEFTRRAFLNGRIGLSQAEAVRDLVEAETFLESSVAIRNLKGDLKSKIASLREQLVDCAAHLEVSLDYPEEDIEDLTHSQIEQRIEGIQRLIEQVLRSYDRFSIVREGVLVTILGSPNVGKSSLLNALLKEERAIVTEIAGTTRDHIEESFTYRGMKYRVVDTAGLRNTMDPVERLGIERTRTLEKKAQIRIYLYDCTLRNELHSSEGPCLHIFNKSDLKVHPDNQKYTDHPRTQFISALKGEGLEKMLDLLHVTSLATYKSEDPEIPVLTSKRQADALREAEMSLSQFLNSLKTGIPIDICMVELYDAVDHLGIITGAVVTEDILDRIFSTFCIGK
ncbi:tRNA uridine-5-carboxymethylaminomethyl(34) synthesis GTPase MnmE [bacterium]|jgi:tRNA modification GTPase|nr:tRNA uridine-5-carboxymethylaminomethyl(34) synthesis GTPase MnmE [bacterium]